MPFPYCVSKDKISLMNKNTLNWQNAEDKNNTPSHYNSQDSKYQEFYYLPQPCYNAREILPVSRPIPR